MNKFLVLNPELRELVGDKKALLAEKEIKQFRISVDSFYDETQRVIFQPDGQSLVLCVTDGDHESVFISSCEVPLELESAAQLRGQVDKSEWPYIYPGQKMEDFPGYRIDYFEQNGKSVEDQVKRHNELIEAGLVDAVVKVAHVDTDCTTLLEIYAGKRFSQEY